MSKTILIVEDEAAIADGIAYALRRDGFAPRHVTLGEQALALLHAEQGSEGAPLLVLLDVGLPDISGFDVCRRLLPWSLRRRRPLRPLPSSCAPPRRASCSAASRWT